MIRRAGWVLGFVFFMLSLSPGAGADTPPTLLNFSQAVDQILERSTDIATQKEQLSETLATNITARTAFLPNVSIQLARFANQDNVLLQRTDGDSLNVTAKLNLFRFGADWKGWQAANGDEDSQTLKLATTIISTENVAVQTLVAEIQALQEESVLSSILKKEQELLKIGRERYGRGLMPQQEVDKIAVDTDNAAAKLADTQFREASARATLVSLLGHDAVESNWPWIDRFRALEANPAQRAPLLGNESDLQTRSDVRSARRNLDAQEDRASQRVRQALPTVDTNATYSSYGLISGQSGSFYDPQWTGSVTLTIPIFDQLAGYSAARVQYFEEQKASTAFEQAQRAALADWSAAKSGFQIALTTAIARDRTVQVSRKLYNDALSRFRLGRINANDLSLEETRLTDSELLSTAGWAQLHTAFAQLCHSRGLKLDECWKR